MNRIILMNDAAAAGGSNAGTGGAGAPPPAPAGDWFANLPAEEKGFVQTKGYKDLTEAVRSHRNLESLLGAPKERLLKLPEKADDKAGWDAIYNKLGRPEKAEGYDPKAFGQGVAESDAKWLQETFHGLNLTKAQGEQLAQKWGGKMQELVKSMSQQKTDASNQQLEKLKQDWGDQFAERIGVSKKVATQLGLSEEQAKAGEAALGVDGWSKMLVGFADKFGVKFDEAGFHIGAGGGTTKMTPEQAQEKLNRLTNDKEWGKRFGSGDAGCRAEFDEIHQILFPGSTSH